MFSSPTSHVVHRVVDSQLRFVNIMPIYKDECVYTFDTPESQHGLDVCVQCGIAVSPDPSRDFSKAHFNGTGHGKFVNIKKVPRPRGPKAVKLAVSAETEADLFETVTTAKDLSGGSTDSPEWQQEIDRILAAESYAKRQEIQAWELDIKPCKHVAALDQDDGARLTSEQLSKCSNCDLTSNLWICLQCGNLNCGRPQFGGGGGNGHALAHFEASQHPLSVKLGSITAEGSVDIYCYLCDEEVKDPSIASHLAHWGIDIAQQEKTEKSLAELQLEQNVKWDFAMSSDGKELEPVMGPGLTGLRNLGNTCYLNSVVQCLFALPMFQAAFPANTPDNTSSTDPANDLLIQLRKMQDGLNSGHYAVKDFQSEDGYQRGFAPAMFKYLIGKNHPEFAGMGQQDAFEFLSYLVGEIQKIAAKSGTLDPTESLQFETENRLECTECHAVRYKIEGQENLSVAVPIEEVAPGEYRPVQLAELLDSFTSKQTLEYSCATCKVGKTAESTTKFKSFPEVFVLNARRFQIVDWVPRKADVPVIVDSSMSLDKYLSKGPQEDENVVVDEEAEFVPNQDALQQLVAMGFPESQATDALKNTGNSSAELAMEFIFNPPAEPSTGDIDDVSRLHLESMGFTTAQATAALQANTSIEAAVEWLFAGNGESITEIPVKVTKKSCGDPSIPANYQLRAIICHKGTSVHVGHYVAYVRHGDEWYLFNDEKVVKGAEIEEMQKFAYIYVFERLR